jgi:hypothetical protein
VSAKLTYTPPAEIDGEPEDVRELSIQQLGEALVQIAELTDQTLRQLHAAGVGREGEAWIESYEAHQVTLVNATVGSAVGAVKALARAV